MKMGVPAMAMHAKSDSEVTSIDAASSPARSPRRALYYVQSPSHRDEHELEKMSYGSSPCGSPRNYLQYQYHCSPIHHSRESSTSRFSASLKITRNPLPVPWKRLPVPPDHLRLQPQPQEDDDDQLEQDPYSHFKFYLLCFLFSFILLFSIFSLILWAASTPYKPTIFVKSMIFEHFNVQAGIDQTGVQTDMLTLNSTVKIFYRNPATFFGVHVTATPLQLYYYNLNIASGHMKKFYQARKSRRVLVVVVEGNQIPVYGAVPILKEQSDSVSVPLNLTFVIRSRAFILGRLVKSKFYNNILCQLTLKGNHLGKPINMTRAASCTYL